MKHNYSNADIRRATVYAGLDVHAADIRLILNALPEPATDDWEECAFDDIQKGDRVKRVTINSDETIATIEGVATYHHLTGWGTNDHYLAFEEDDPQENITLYRIPAPVQHPDPAEHPVILVHEAYDLTFDPPLGMIWDAGSHYESPSHRIQPDQITRFTPAKVVEDDR